MCKGEIMFKKEVKNCVIIYNPVSTGFKEDSLNKIAKTAKDYGLNPSFAKSMYQGNVIDLVKENDRKDTLIITLGGDGTVKEAYTGLSQVKQKGIYAHVPTGTTNDMAKNYDVKQTEPDKIIEDILNGEIKMFDTYSINGQIAAYTAVFGHLAHVPFITSPKLKKNFGYAGYVICAGKEIVKKPVKYDISYQTENLYGRDEFILGAVSNTKGFAGINLYDNAKLNDGKIELLLLKNINAKMITTIVNDFLHNRINLANYKEHIILTQSNEIKLTFNDKFPNYPVDVDGENSKITPNFVDKDLIFKIEKPIRILKRKKNQ